VPSCNPVVEWFYSPICRYYDDALALVTNTPKPLIDWPRSDMIDINATSSRACNGICVEMNAYAVMAMEQASAVAERMGMADIAQNYARKAMNIRVAAHNAFASSRCTPSAPACYTDNRRTDTPSLPTTTAPATALAAVARLPGTANDTLRLVPFLRARNLRRGVEHGLEVSGWLAGFMLKGLYSAAGETEEGFIPPELALDAANFAFAVLVANGTNSWLNMLQQNATMTMEAWSEAQGINEGGGTYSHPWTAAPATIVPRWLSGVRPLEDAWRRIALSPLPPQNLLRFSINVPTMRGSISLSAVSDPVAKTFTMAFDVPGNTGARVCFPRYLFTGQSAACVTELDGAATMAAAAGALLCLADDVGAGRHSAIMHC